MDIGSDVEKREECLKSEITYDFENPHDPGKHHVIKLIRNKLDGDDWKIYIDDIPIKNTDAKPVNEYKFCEKDPEGNERIGKETYTCHTLVAASDAALLVGNSLSCPIFLNPPGIVIDP